jgi:2-C-methyl-D-erythritol 4-phosphate cytidylyltransferase/2-C-methyl-D-erythritol 2,4-cyclodiphosphate synthase
VLAAGKGTRVGGDRPKQLMDLLGRPIVIHALEQHHRLGHHVIVVVSESTQAPIEEMVAEFLPGAAIRLIRGGDTRRESVMAGVDAIPPATHPHTGVVLRNAASPNTPDSLIESCIKGMETHDGMQAYVPSNETTFIRANDNLDWLIARDVTGFTVDPTVYRCELIRGVAEQMRTGGLGETTLDIARRLHANIGLVESPRSNFKLTTARDLHRLEVAMLDPAAYD